MSLDLILNLLWLALGLSGLGALAYSEFRRAPESGHGWLRRLLAVLLITLSLFPCVSASDDIFTFSFLQTHSGKHGGVGNAPPEESKERHQSYYVFRLLQSLEGCQVAAVYALILTLCVCEYVCAAGFAPLAVERLCRAGRAPPSFSV